MPSVNYAGFYKDFDTDNTDSFKYVGVIANSDSQILFVATDVEPKTEGGIDTDTVVNHTIQYADTHARSQILYSDSDDMQVLTIKERTADNGTAGNDVFYIKNNGDTSISGKLGIGTSTPSQKLHVHGNIISDRIYGGLRENYGGVAGDGIPITGTKGSFYIDSIEDNTDGTGTNGIYLNNWGGTGGVHCMDGSGGYGKLTAGVINALQVKASGVTLTSDDRLKHNEENITGALETINKLKLQKYDKTHVMMDADFNGDLTGFESIKEAGFIAQAVMEIPELAFLVGGGGSHETIDKEAVVNDVTPATYKTVELPYNLNYIGLSNYAIQAIQELDSKYKAKISSLEDTILSLVSRLEALEN